MDRRWLLHRRELLAGLALTACTRTPPERKADEPPSWPRTTTHAGVEGIELFPNGATETSPLVVAIHGLGDRPSNWVDEWRKFPAKAQILLPRAFTPYGDGFSWFPLPPDRGRMNENTELATSVAAAAAKLWAGIEAVAGTRKPIVTGFSQGGMLSYTMAVQHPTQVRKALPVSGFCPTPLYPKGSAASVLAFHGASDPLLPIQWDRDTVAAFRESHNEASTLREYPGVGHTISPSMREDWWAALVDLVNAS